METIAIPLDITLTPANNANKYFKEYKKTYKKIINVENDLIGEC